MKHQPAAAKLVAHERCTSGQENTMHSELPIGAHLTTPRWGYVHHGIYAGDGQVIHYAGFSRPLRRGPVEQVPLARFTRGKPLRVKTQETPRFDGAAALERARSRLGENRYRFWSNNCEHLVEWCLSGKSRSEQVDAWLQRARAGLALMDGLVPRRPARPDAA